MGVEVLTGYGIWPCQVSNVTKAIRIVLAVVPTDFCSSMNGIQRALALAVGTAVALETVPICVPLTHIVAEGVAPVESNSISML